MPRFAAGVVRFQNEVYPEKKALFEKLSQGQSPEAMFITCSDSRIETAMITQTDPGELFVCRNAGNIVPPHSEYTGGITASIEFAVTVLKVPHIVVCGHTHCGAMHGALNPSIVEPMPHVKEWLSFTKEAVDHVHQHGKNCSDEERAQMLLEQNVILQLAHLKTHPVVQKALSEGALTLHGWVYDIKSGDVIAYDADQNTFVPVGELYAEAIESD